MNKTDTPLPIVPAPEPIDPALAPLLRLVDTAPAPPTADALRARLLGRLAASRAAAQAMVTRRIARCAPLALADGVQAVPLYEHDPGARLRPGEPLRARLIDLAPGAAWVGPGPGVHREWLVLQGRVSLGEVMLGERDYHVDPAPAAAARLASAEGARVFLRESDEPAGPGDASFTVHDAQAGWPEFAPGIRRRVLWQRGGQAALLYLAQPGASVPQHAHGHDEECLMVRGELFLDDLLLRAGDYQLAPAGTGHRITETDTGVVIYAHGDLDLRFL